MMRLQYWVILTFTAALILIAGCGGGNNAATNNPTTTLSSANPPATTPPPTNPPPTMPPPTNPPPTTMTAQYEAALLRPGKTGEVAGGQIIVNLNGASGVGSVKATNGAVNATYTITFLPFTHSTSSFPVGTVTSDASGNINGSFTFPQKGTFAGIFHLSAGTNAFNTEIDPMDSGVDNNTNFVFNVPLVRSGTVSPALNDFSITGTDPLTSGTVVAGGGHVHVELHGAAPNGTYTIGACGVNDSSSCSELTGGTLTTDSSGNGTLDVNGFLEGNGDPSVIVEVFRNAQRQYVSGFTVQ